MLSRRQFIATTGATATLAASPSWAAQGKSPNDEVGLAFIGLGVRGQELLKAFSRIAGVRVVALCDVDSERIEKAALMATKAAQTQDLQEVLDRDDVDAVVIATPNHWHCLAAVRACQAGKDVYVEKPLGHNLWEQEQLIKAARKHGRMVQVGTQQRSSPVQARAKELLHDEQAIGKLQNVVVSRVGGRKPIGKRDTPLTPPSTVDYNLWLGPAIDQPLYRNQLHYDWHWDWNTGNGEMGNWGVHVLDDALNVALMDRAGFPTAVRSAGVRAAWNDAANTPNVQVAHYQNSELPLTMILSNIVPAEPLMEGAHYQGFPAGYIVYGEGGRFCGSRGRWQVFDADGKLMEENKGNAGDRAHKLSFLEAVRTRDRSKLAAEVELGHVSSAWCHLASIAALEGEAADKPSSSSEWNTWQELQSGFDAMVSSADSNLTPPAAGQIDVDSDTGAVKKIDSEQAQQLVERTYRSTEWADQFKV